MIYDLFMIYSFRLIQAIQCGKSGGLLGSIKKAINVTLKFEREGYTFNNSFRVAFVEKSFYSYDNCWPMQCIFA